MFTHFYLPWTLILSWCLNPLLGNLISTHSKQVLFLVSCPVMWVSINGEKLKLRCHLHSRSLVPSCFKCGELRLQVKRQYPFKRGKMVFCDILRLNMLTVLALPPYYIRVINNLRLCEESFGLHLWKLQTWSGAYLSEVTLDHMFYD